VKVSGTWPYAYRAVDEEGQFIDLLVWKKREDRSSHMVLR
jgi:transposase-like protein